MKQTLLLSLLVLLLHTLQAQQRAYYQDQGIRYIEVPYEGIWRAIPFL